MKFVFIFWTGSSPVKTDWIVSLVTLNLGSVENPGNQGLSHTAMCVTLIMQGPSNNRFSLNFPIQCVIGKR